MEWVYLSPHLDDVALSCGGLVRRQVRLGEPVAIWTICAGDPPAETITDYARQAQSPLDLDANAPALRRQEDRQACRILGAEPIYFSIPDCIYRLSPADQNPLYTSDTAIFGQLDPAEEDLVDQLADNLSENLSPDSQVVSPLAIGGHVDHRLTRMAAQRLGCPLWYYPDFPYVSTDLDWRGQPRQEPGQPIWERVHFALKPTDLTGWQDAVAEYRSQIPVFWPDEDTMRQALADYSRRLCGQELWRPD